MGSNPNLAAMLLLSQTQPKFMRITGEKGEGKI